MLDQPGLNIEPLREGEREREIDRDTQRETEAGHEGGVLRLPGEVGWRVQDTLLTCMKLSHA